MSIQSKLNSVIQYNDILRQSQSWEYLSGSLGWKGTIVFLKNVANPDYLVRDIGILH